MPTATIDRLDNFEFTITVKLAPDDYRGPARAELKKLAKKAQIKGFRPGKVPSSYMEKLYGRGVLGETISKAVDKEINDLVAEEKLDIFGQMESVEEPDLSNLSMSTNEELVFIYEGGLLPKTDTVDVSGLKELGRYSVKLDDAEIATKLDDARKRFADYNEREDIETEEDFATLVVADADLDAKYFGDAGAAHSAEPTKGNDAKDDADADTAEHDVEAVEVEEDEPETDNRQKFFLRPADLIEAQRNKLIGKTKGTEIILSLDDFNDDVRERFNKIILEDGTTSFTIAKVDREEMPGYSEETFKKIFGEDTEIKTEEEAKAELNKRYATNSQSNLDDFALEQIIDRLDADNELAIPTKAVKHRLEMARDEEIAKAKEENRKPAYDHDLSQADMHGLGRRLRWLAFRQHLVDQYDIELEKADIDEGLEQQYITDIGGMGLDPEQYREQFFPMFKKNFLENRERVMDLTDGLLNKKLLHKLEEEGLLKPKQEIGEAKFQEVVTAYNDGINSTLDEMRKQPLS